MVVVMLEGKLSLSLRPSTGDVDRLAYFATCDSVIYFIVSNPHFISFYTFSLCHRSNLVGEPENDNSGCLSQVEHPHDGYCRL